MLRLVCWEFRLSEKPTDNSYVSHQDSKKRPGYDPHHDSVPADGDLVEVKIRSKFPKADDDYTPAQRRKIDARLAKADKDIKRGRLYGPFDTHEQFIASLHQEARKLRAKNKRPAES